MLAGCAGTTPGGRQQLAMPQPVGSIYSGIDLDLQLAAAPAPDPCEGLHCKVQRGFEQQVARLGARLAAAAYRADPDLKERIPAFRFVVADKAPAGTGSDAGGTVVVFRGVRRGPLDEESLAFLIAREMGHVIGRHHEERSAAGIVSTLLAKALLGPISLAQNSSFFASSAASALGKEMIRSSFAAEHDREAEAIALGLLAGQGWSRSDVADSLAAYAATLDDDSAWVRTIRESANRLRPPVTTGAAGPARPPGGAG